MELHLTAGVTSAVDGMAACIRYVERLPLTPERQREVLARVAERVGAGRRDAVAELHRVLSGNNVEWDGPACGSLRRRLALAVDERAAVTTDVQGRVRLVTAPSLNRSPMAPKQWSRWLKIWPIRMIRDWDKRGRFVSRREGEDNSHPDRKDPWHRAAAWRRTTLLALVLGQTYVAALAMMTVLPYHGQQSLEIAILSLFAILFAWISAGFWTAISGFVLLLRGRDRHAISASAVGDAPIADAARTAIVMPICNEDVARVFAGLRATYESLRRTGELKHFDFFILSDSADPDTRIAETEAWLTMCRDLHAFGHVFYRRRQHRIKRKSGNVADFCRRWGSSYRYMVVVDADSVMSGECLTTLVRLMETNPTAGIIQTAPRASGRETFYARVQQFANRVYGPLFTAGMHFWQLGESHYWGHNAIIRVAPFIRHCALGRLPGRGRFSGEILSHDFVEAALMRRAGWAVWLAYDLPGSWEEMPPNLLDELKRDRRWCLGNLINARLLFAKGLHAAHRVVFATGVMAYFSGLLWFLFLVLSTALLAVHTLVPPEYFVTPNQLFPIWPEWNPAYAVALFSATSALLFLPKVLAGILVIVQGAQRFGGSLRVVASMVIESIFSMLLAPIRMLFHTQFIVSGLIGWTIRWKSPIRTDAETPWLEALRRHGAHTLLGMGWAVGVYALNPSYLTWLLPVVGALMLSIPLSVLSSRVSFGRRLRAARLFLIPEESKPPRELRWTLRAVRRAQPVADFVRAVVDPLTNAVACASSVARTLRQPVQRRERTQLVHEAAATDPEMLTTAQKMALLNDPVALSQLHFEIWTSAGSHPKWLASISAPVRTALTLPHTREHRRPVIASAR